MYTQLGCSNWLSLMPPQSEPGFSFRQRQDKIRRFFLTDNVEAILRTIFLIIIILLPDLRKAHLVIDRTNWAFGKSKHIFLTLCLMYEGCCIPLLWTDLGYKGNSNYKH